MKNNGVRARMVYFLKATAERCVCIAYTQCIYKSFKEKAFRSNQKPCASVLFLQRIIYLGGAATFGEIPAGIVYCLYCTKHKETLNLRYYLCIIKPTGDLEAK